MLIVVLVFIALSSCLVWYLLSHDHGRKLPVGKLWQAFGFGLLAIALAVLLEELLLGKLVNTPQSFSIGARLFGFLGVGAIEELAKFVPLALVIFHKPYFREHTDGVIYFAICGLTFGAIENILYTLTMGAGTGLVRLALTPFFHAAATSILGFYLASYKINRGRRNQFILALVLVPLIHGIYDFGLMSGIGIMTVLSLMLTLLLTMGLFLYFMTANEQDRALEAAAAVNGPNFCPHCGHPNTAKQKFCVYCGQQL